MFSAWTAMMQRAWGVRGRPAWGVRGVSHCPCRVLPLPFAAKTVPFLAVLSSFCFGSSHTSSAQPQLAGNLTVGAGRLLGHLYTAAGNGSTGSSAVVDHGADGSA